MMSLINKYFQAKLKNVNFILKIFIISLLVIPTLFSLPGSACHCVGTYESDFITPKTIFVQGEIIYGKVSWDPAKDVKLRL